MSQVIDSLIAYRILNMLVKPFKETDAYKLGIIDAKGKNLIKPSSFTTSEQKNAYTFLNRLVFNMKRIINRLPGGENKLKSLVTAYFLIKEYYEKNERSTSLMEARFNKIMEMEVILAEETMLVEKFMKSLDEDGGGGGGGGPGGGGVSGGGGAPANSTGSLVSTDIPVPKKKDIDKYKKMNTGVLSMTRRNAKVM
jgi:uncharacterized membrane protein YgcG